MPGGRNLAELTGSKEQYWACGGNQSEFGCRQGWTASLTSFFSRWNKGNRVLILPILGFVIGGNIFAR
jgi:hypothetical protein